MKNHYCRNAAFTCLDCSKTFYGQEYNTHNQCISEAEKYEKSLYNPKKKNGRQNGNGQQQQQQQNGKSNQNNQNNNQKQLNDKISNRETPEEKNNDDTPKKKEAEKEKLSDTKNKDTLLADLIKEPTNLYKIVKKLEKSSKKDKKDILKGLTVEKLADGTLVLKPSTIE